jgi:ribose-phosphate pyrophosphokinase
MPSSQSDGTVRSLVTRVSNVENDEAEEGVEESTEDAMSVSLSSLNEMSAAVSVVADTDGEESTITLVGDVVGKVVFLTVCTLRHVLSMLLYHCSYPPLLC